MVKQDCSSCCAGNGLWEARVEEVRQLLESIVITQARDGGAVEIVVGAVDVFGHGLVLEIFEGRAKPIF